MFSLDFKEIYCIKREQRNFKQGAKYPIGTNRNILRMKIIVSKHLKAREIFGAYNSSSSGIDAKYNHTNSPFTKLLNKKTYPVLKRFLISEKRELSKNHKMKKQLSIKSNLKGVQSSTLLSELQNNVNIQQNLNSTKNKEKMKQRRAKWVLVHRSNKHAPMHNKKKTLIQKFYEGKMPQIKKRYVNITDRKRILKSTKAIKIHRKNTKRVFIFPPKRLRRVFNSSAALNSYVFPLSNVNISSSSKETKNTNSASDFSAKWRKYITKPKTNRTGIQKTFNNSDFLKLHPYIETRREYSPKINERQKNLILKKLFHKRVVQRSNASLKGSELTRVQNESTLVPPLLSSLIPTSYNFQTTVKFMEVENMLKLINNIGTINSTAIDSINSTAFNNSVISNQHNTVDDIIRIQLFKDFLKDTNFSRRKKESSVLNADNQKNMLDPQRNGQQNKKLLFLILLTTIIITLLFIMIAFSLLLFTRNHEKDDEIENIHKFKSFYYIRKVVWTILLTFKAVTRTNSKSRERMKNSIVADSRNYHLYGLPLIFRTSKPLFRARSSQSDGNEERIAIQHHSNEKEYETSGINLYINVKKPNPESNIGEFCDLSDNRKKGIWKDNEEYYTLHTESQSSLYPRSASSEGSFCNIKTLCSRYNEDFTPWKKSASQSSNVFRSRSAIKCKSVTHFVGTDLPADDDTFFIQIPSLPTVESDFGDDSSEEFNTDQTTDD